MSVIALFDVDRLGGDEKLPVRFPRVHRHGEVEDAVAGAIGAVGVRGIHEVLVVALQVQPPAVTTVIEAVTACSGSTM